LISLIVLTVSLVAAIFQFRRTSRKAEVFIEDFNKGVSPLLRSFVETSTELQKLSYNLNKRMEKTDEIVTMLHQATETLVDLSKMTKKTVMPVIAQVSVIEAGVKAFTHFFSKKRR